MWGGGGGDNCELEWLVTGVDEKGRSACKGYVITYLKLTLLIVDVSQDAAANCLGLSASTSALSSGKTVVVVVVESFTAISGIFFCPPHSDNATFLSDAEHIILSLGFLSPGGSQQTFAGSDAGCLGAPAMVVVEVEEVVVVVVVDVDVVI